MPTVVLGACLFLSVCCTGKGIADAVSPVGDAAETGYTETSELPQNTDADPEGSILPDCTQTELKDDVFPATETAGDVGALEPPGQDVSAGDGPGDWELDEELVEIQTCELPTQWGRLNLVRRMANVRIGYQTECPDVNGDGVGDNGLATFTETFIDWPRSQPSQPPVEDTEYSLPTPLDPPPVTVPSWSEMPVGWCLPAPFLVHYPADTDSSGTTSSTLSLLGWKPSPDYLDSRGVLVYEGSFVASPGQEECVPAFALDAQWSETGVTAEAQGEIEAPFSLVMQFSPYPHCPVVPVPFTLSRVRFRGDQAGGILSGVLRRSDVEKWFESASDKEMWEYSPSGWGCNNVCNPKPIGTTIDQAKALLIFLAQLSTQFSQSYDVDLTGDGVQDGVSFCVQLSFEELPATVVGSSPYYLFY